MQHVAVTVRANRRAGEDREIQILDLLPGAIDSPRANLLRTALTVLGIVIGVATVIAMVSLVEGFNRGVTESFESFGSTLVQSVVPKGMPLICIGQRSIVPVRRIFFCSSNTP